jgi:enoyl-CoA hydratase/carnithine racemase
MSTLKLSVANGGIAVVTLANPPMNAMDATLLEKLANLFEGLAADRSIRAGVVVADGPAFSAGLDLKTVPSLDRLGQRQLVDALNDGFGTLYAWPKPLVAAVNGHAIGIGLTLALQCDLRFVAADARYGVVQVRRGVLPDAYSHWTLPRIAGLAAAADVLLTGRLFDGREAKELGLASRCLPGDEVLPEALAVARSIATDVAPLSAALSKRLLWGSLDRTPAEVGALETALHHHVMGRADAREGVEAFLEGRPPLWRSRVGRDWPEGL